MKFTKVLLVLSVAANLGLAYLLLDSGVTVTHQASAREAVERSAAACLDVVRLDWMGRAESEVVALPQRLKGLGRPAGDLYVKREGEVLSVLDLAFRVRDAKVVQVGFYGDVDLPAGTQGTKK